MIAEYDRLAAAYRRLGHDMLLLPHVSVVDCADLVLGMLASPTTRRGGHEKQPMRPSADLTLGVSVDAPLTGTGRRAPAEAKPVLIPVIVFDGSDDIGVMQGSHWP